MNHIGGLAGLVLTTFAALVVSCNSNPTPTINPTPIPPTITPTATASPTPTPEPPLMIPKAQNLLAFKRIIDKNYNEYIMFFYASDDYTNPQEEIYSVIGINPPNWNVTNGPLPTSNLSDSNTPLNNSGLLGNLRGYRIDQTGLDLTLEIALDTNNTFPPDTFTRYRVIVIDSLGWHYLSDPIQTHYDFNEDGFLDMDGKHSPF